MHLSCQIKIHSRSFHKGDDVSSATRSQLIQRIRASPSKMNSKNAKDLKRSEVQPAKSGLLYFDDSIDPKPNTFDSAEVLADGPIESLGNVNVICTKERKSPTTPSQRPLPPFWTDNMSTWERDGGSPRKEKNKKVPDKESVQSQTSPPNNGGSKFRRTVSSKKSSPVNMSKLLSFGYVDEDKASANETESSAT
ncbi:uncharacterized protein LOC130931874 isoform X3 [Corythoichthys intestinalis]|uniref:uncharacterized protein LOC130931874 isoform X3 n=2 Tax=Corythoichthys intestinalis TaxID=161448 RepID=UPI0025A4CEED|nr:uncharacterized protein LOC130931874 isoform X3 [Corythoichthys intestinalis]